MSVILLEGFDNYNVVGGELTSSSFPGIGFTVTANGSGLVKVSDGAKSGSKAIQLARSDKAHSTLSKQITTTDDVINIGFAFNATGRDMLFKITDLVTVSWANGKPTIGQNEAKNTPILNTWYFAEFTIDKVNKNIGFKLNGYDQFNGSKVPILDDIPDTIELVWGFPTNGPAAVFRLDDLYVSTGDALGTMAISTRLPTANGTVEWSPVPGEKQNYEILSRIPADTSEYVESSTAGSRDTYLNDKEVVGSKILAVGVSVLASKTDVDDQEISLVLKNDAGELVSQGQSLTLDYNYVQAYFETGIDGEEWKPEDIASTEFGFEMK